MSRMSFLLLPLIVACTDNALTSGPGGEAGADLPTDIERVPGDREFASNDDANDSAPVEFRSLLRGNFGAMGQFGDEMSEIDPSIGPYNSTVTFHTLGDHGWAMLRLNINGQLGTGQLRPGETVYLSGFGIENDDDAIVVDGSVQGCTGPDMWNFDDDLFTDDVVIGLSQHPETGSLVIDLEADFYDGSHMIASAVIE